MKVALIGFFIVLSAVAQAQSDGLPAACGPDGERFKVKLDDKPPAALPLEAGQARIYFIHNSGSSWSVGYPTSLVGMDGAWFGANHGDSWFSVSVAPGEHHLCAALQTSLLDQSIELAHFTAEPGKTYYYRTRLILSGSVELMEFEPIDSDQGEYLIGSFAMSISSEKGKAARPNVPKTLLPNAPKTRLQDRLQQ